LCHVSELSDFNIKDTAQELDLYCIGDCVTALILSVNTEEGRINLSFKKSRCQAVNTYFSLGKSDSSFEDEYGSSDDEKTEVTSKNYNELLEKDTAFHNTYSLDSMIAAFSINPYSTFQHPLNPVNERDTWENLREEQSQLWAKETVAKGIGFAKSGDYANAIKCYTAALDVCATYKDAYVARGAAYANQNLLSNAIKEFNLALQLDPSHANALKYRQRCLQLMEQEKVGTTAPAPITSANSTLKDGQKTEVHQKLKALLKAEVKKKKKRKRKEKDKRKEKTREKDKDKKKRRKVQQQHRKHKRRKRSHSDSSSSSVSSASSTSSPSSSDSDST